MNVQQIASVARQGLAVVAVAMGAVTAALPSLGLPVAVSSALVAVGGVILTVEHYVADPSTGRPTQPPPS